MRAIVTLHFVLTAFLLAACSDQGTPRGAANIANEHTVRSVDEVPQAASAPADERATEKTDFEGTADRTEKKNTPKEAAVLRDVRTGRHESFDRIVFEFEGSEMPGYFIEYIDKPVRACGSGNVVPLKGDGWLQIRFEPARAHTDQGKPTLGFRELRPMMPIVLELSSTCDFEGQVEWVAGVASPNRYRVLELASPTRLVVDIRQK